MDAGKKAMPGPQTETKTQGNKGVGAGFPR